MSNQPPAPINDPFAERFQKALDTLPRQMFFIVGAQKSGTTWLQGLLNGHPDVACYGESRIGHVLLPLLEQVIEQHNTQARMGDFLKFDQADFVCLARMAIGLMFNHWKKRDLPPCLGEKTPEHALVMPALAAIVPHAKFIHIIRDCRDGAVSGWFHNKRDNTPNFDERFPTFASYVTYYAETHWVRYIRFARQFGHANPNRYMEVRYETLHAEPDATVRSMLQFLNLRTDDETINACRDAGSFKTLTQGRVRGEEDAGSHYRKGVIGDWKNHFDATSEAAFLKAAGPLADELGYLDASLANAS